MNPDNTIFKNHETVNYHHELMREEDTEAIVARCHALGSPERLKILRALHNTSLTVTEVADLLYMSVSTASHHLRILRDAGLINIALMPGKRGHVQLCQRWVSSLLITTGGEEAQEEATYSIQEIPVGLYTDCGMEYVAGFCTADESFMFDTGNYYDPRRAEAQLIWSSGGYVEYAFSNTHAGKPLKSITISLEICSDTLNYQLGWKSDLTFWLSGVELVTYTSPSDFGGRRGRLNPAWWENHCSQYGELKVITVTEDGCMLDGRPVTGDNIPSVKDFSDMKTLFLRIGNKPDAANYGGFNIFGRGFGDHTQDIRIELAYE